ncbi:MAG: hypothetical protein IJJ33_17785 [Victivallales bacterium]|nr:hypothetical protein [Victivallales bacterium]
MRVFEIIAVLLATVVSVFGLDRVVFAESFQSSAALENWRMVSGREGAVFSISPNGLNLRHRNTSPGVFVESAVPVIRRGRLEFDVTVNPGADGVSNGIGLTLDLYNVSTFWHDACKDWRMYFPEPNSRRLPNYFIEPVGHRMIAPVKAGRKSHYKICFDADSDLVEFYLDDMDDPAAVRYDVSVLGHAFYQGGFLRLGSFGYAPKEYCTEIGNIVLREETPDQAETTERTLALVFDGMSSQHYPVRRLLRSIKPSNIRQYVWDSPGPFDPNTNNYRYFKLPGFASLERAEIIIFNDAPIVEDALQKKILASVEGGAKLLVMGGLYTLNRGGFAHSRLGNALPVLLDETWNLAGDGKHPVSLHPPRFQAVIYYWLKFKPAKDAEVLMTAAGAPVLFRRKLGKGSIAVFAGTALGPVEKNVFWKTSLLQEIFDCALKGSGGL